MWRWTSSAALLQDIRYGFRQLRRSIGFTVVAVLTLALGVGANTAIFSLINALMLRLLPVRDPGRLVELLHRYPGEPRMNGFSWQSYEHFRDHNQVFSGLIGFSPTRFSLGGEGENETVDGEYVVGDFFPVLGVKPALGRLVAPDDDRLGAVGSAVAVVSWSYWKTRFNMNPDIVGKQITLDGVPVAIIGVTSREFFGLRTWSRPSVWVPAAMASVISHPAQTSWAGLPLNLIGRLKPAVSIVQARADLSVLFQFTLDEMSKHSKDPLWRQMTLEVAPAGAGQAFLRDQFTKPLLVLMALVGLLLLIACTSVAGMLLARGAAREHEMALRVSLGAGRIRLLRQVLTESLLLSVTSGALGIVVAFFGAHWLVRTFLSGRQIVGLPSNFIFEVQPDGHVLLFTLGVALLTGLLFGMVPALRAMATPPASMLRGAARPTPARVARFVGRGLVAAQVSLSVVVLSLAGVFTRHLADLRHQLGFHSDHLLLVTLDPARSGYSAEQISGLYAELLGRLEGLPGVRSAALASPTPISGRGAASFVNVEGFQEKPEDRRYVMLAWITPDYFRTLGIPVIGGRDLTFRDQGGPRVVIINQAMARYYFTGANPLGKHLTLDRDWKGIGGADKPYEIVGVVGDAKYDDPHGATPRTIYLAAFQEGRMFADDFILRTAIAPMAVTGEVGRVVDEVLKNVSVADVTTMDDQVNAAIVPERIIAMLSSSFGTLGALLAALGLYGLLAYMLARRTREIGIRMALGASRGSVASMILRDSLATVSAGVAVGVPMAFWGRQFATRVVEGLPATRFVPIALGTACVIAVTLLASYLPTRRATEVDPLEALRYE